jgi:hypothetical protein
MPNAYGNNASNVPKLHGAYTGVKTGMQLGQRIQTNLGSGTIIGINLGEMGTFINYNISEPFILTVLLDCSQLPVQLYWSDFTFRSYFGAQSTVQAEKNNNL